ncbi:hypothetical protein HWI79_1398 [Cryptosporidium felis]|nr:hypothetical protein HWI79_1398 [Cryptosporidium felis]
MTEMRDNDAKNVVIDPPNARKGFMTGNGLVKHVLVGSIFAVLLGGFSKFYFSWKQELPDSLSSIITSERHKVIDHEVVIRGTFGEETQLEFGQENSIVLENLPQEGSLGEGEDLLYNHEEDFEEEPEDHEFDDGDEVSEGEGEDENEAEMDDETLKRLLKENVQLELDEGFSTKESLNEESIEVLDDPEVEEYEHEQETDDFTDNNWSDDESEVKKMEKEAEEQTRIRN